MANNHLKNHTASGQALGYYFQLERAIIWLAQSPMDAVIGIETDDDVVVELANGKKILEQDKSSTTSFPFNLSRKDLWNTLYIWLNGVKVKEIDLENTSLYLVTNKSGKGSFAEKLGSAEKDKDVNDLISEIRKFKPSDSIKNHYKKVNEFSDKELSNLIKKIKFEDGSLGSNNLKITLLNSLGLNNDDDSLDLLSHLIGWVYMQVVEAWKAKKPALIERNVFAQVKLNFIMDRIERVFNEQVNEVSKEKINQQRSETFVEQLNIIKCNENEITTAIREYIQAIEKMTELAIKGEITKKDIKSMQDECKQKWSILFRKIPLQNKGNSKEEIGRLILYDSLDYRAWLGKIQPSSRFFTAGTFHKLSNLLKIGWHPDYKTIFGVENDR